MTYSLHPEAEDEFREAARWYESQQEGISGEFRREMDNMIGLIVQNPLMFAEDEDTLARVALVNRFPYTINYYPRRGNHLFIAAIAHTSREPGYWLHRVRR